MERYRRNRKSVMGKRKYGLSAISIVLAFVFAATLLLMPSPGAAAQKAGEP